MSAAPSRLVEALRTGFWAVPAGCVVLALLLAFGLVEADRALGDDLGRFTFGAGPDGAREVLSAITTSMITFTGLVFSITIVVRLLTPPLLLVDLLALALDEIEQYGSDSQQVQARVDTLLTDLLDAALPEHQPALLARQERRAGCTTLPAPSTTTIPSTTER